MSSSRPRGLARKTGINLLPIVIYVTVAVVLTAGMYAWDVQYRRQQEAARRPPAPEVIAKNLVENVVGADVVKEVKVDREKKSLAISFESALFKPEKPKKELRELLDAEATLATQAILVQMRDIDRVVATLTNQGKTLATAEAVRGKDRVTTTFVDERLKE
ncbi:MAG: hypothetical protein A2Z07_07850 [Armatimonadetes bacterium RBG_16_67_12]|nr:MAG: hypothetical protein A2Z07_07850 [Armatimonadetes bacterium RBG_16_67_12]